MQRLFCERLMHRRTSLHSSIFLWHLSKRSLQQLSFRGLLPNVQYANQHSLYNSSNEKESCGVGLLANLESKPERDTVINANTMLVRMSHRGGCGCDPSSGDGAGILLSMPHEFMSSILNKEFPTYKHLKKGEYAVGNVFFNQFDSKNSKIDNTKELIQYLCESAGFNVIGWRKVPTDNEELGELSLSSEPIIEQLFIENTKQLPYTDFERDLLRLRSLCANEILHRAGDPNENIYGDCYICSLSSRTITYKGQLMSEQLYKYYPDLQHPLFASYFALVHSRFSTNTFPSWDRAQPNRVMCHNGEINTLRGNKNWMNARSSLLESRYFGPAKTKDLLPACSDAMSDSGNFDSVLEILTKAGDFSLPEGMLMMIPEAWETNNTLDPKVRAMYQYYSCLMEPYDGPAMMAFTDGNFFGAMLDRNGLRPCRYYVTKDNYVALSSEIGVLPNLKPSNVSYKGRLEPGKMFLIDFNQKRILSDEEIKSNLSMKKPYVEWIDRHLINVSKMVENRKQSLVKNDNKKTANYDRRIKYENLARRLNMFGYTTEILDMILLPMCTTGKEPLGSMGNDAPLAIQSEKAKLPYEYFKQLFAQVTNPPIDPIRESLVMSLRCPVGPQGNIINCDEQHAMKLVLDSPILTYEEMNFLKEIEKETNGQYSSKIVDISYSIFPDSEYGLLDALRQLQEHVADLINNQNEKTNIIVLSDRLAGFDRYPIPGLLALGAVHQHLLRTKQRTQIGLFIEAGDAKEVHDFCLLTGFGADGVLPYVAYEALNKMNLEGTISAKTEKEFTPELLYENYRKACNLGIKKVMSKMGISTLQSYKGAQVFEAIGLGNEIMEMCFQGTTSRLQGIDFRALGKDVQRFHDEGYPPHSTLLPLLRSPGTYHYRDNCEKHYNTPENMVALQKSVRLKDFDEFRDYCKQTDELTSQIALRGLLKFKPLATGPISIDDVESEKEIMKRFNTGAMSLGSISKEAHETLAVAMNSIQARSNTGEGGEEIERLFDDSRCSAIKQVASARFGVTIEYLSQAKQIQIKMAQGAKPGEGGELPGHKVSEYIGKLRHTTPGVGLISPPPHHDIYSIEDLAQLIHDLKNANPQAEISVKLVSEVGVGVVAAGVAKAFADHITISGHDGGTGASSWTGIKHGGLPWELGLAETQQTLVLNDLRSRVRLQTDGQLKTPKDILVAACLGAEEFGFSTAPLIAIGCVMMRKCHLNTCPVGIATQDPILRKKFQGKPEHVVNFCYFLAKEIRHILARVGVRSMDEIIGNVNLLEVDQEKLNSKTSTLDLSSILVNSASLNPKAKLMKTIKQRDVSKNALDLELIKLAEKTLKNPEDKTVINNVPIENIHRTVGAQLSNTMIKRNSATAYPEDSIHIHFKGSGGQSFGFGLLKGLFMELEGDSNDYVGKALSGGKLAIYPAKEMQDFKAEDNIIVGNASLYGGTSGFAYICGGAGERFAVRNSGVNAVVESVGAHGCEYMTGGKVAILGPVGRNFAAGMSGGIAYVYDKQNILDAHCNREMVRTIPLTECTEEDIQSLKELIEQHVNHTRSNKGQQILNEWEESKKYFIKVVSPEYERLISQRKVNQ